MNLQEEQLEGARKAVSFKLAGDLVRSVPPQINWAMGELKARFDERVASLRPTDFSATDAVNGTLILIALTSSEEITEACEEAGIDLPETPESFVMFRHSGASGSSLVVYGSDTLGLVYALTELSDRIRFASEVSDALDFGRPLIEAPTAKVRSISKCFQSEIEDLPWFHDRDSWRDYLTMLVTHRFNRFSLTFGKQYNYPYGNEFVSDVYFHLAYPFLVSMPGDGVAVSNLTDEERRRNLDTLKFIGREAALRGLEFQVALWTQSYDFDDCPNARHQITGLGPDNIAEYCRDALAAILSEVPEITGLTLRVHVECGIAEGDYAFWRTYFEALEQAGRTVRLDLHAKGIDDELIDIALATGMPVCISPKYTSEHMGLPYHQASIRNLELPSRDSGQTDPGTGRDATLYGGDDAERHAGKWRFSEGSRKFMRYSYGDLMREDRSYGIIFRIWPGTTRILIWGDPVLAGGYGRNSIFCGAAGVELCEPLSFKGRMGTGKTGSRTGYQEKYRLHRYDWQKFEYTYRVWGRSLFTPNADRDTFTRFLRSKVGLAADSCGRAIASASRILPLITLAHTPTASNNSYWPEMYENMSIVHTAPHLPYGYELPVGSRFGTVGSCDPQLFMSPVEFAECVHSGTPARRLSPLTWANWLERYATDATEEMARANGARPEQTELFLISVDVTILASIGKFFAEKIRAAVLWEFYLLSGSAEAGRAAVARYRAARDAWAVAADVCKDVYLPDITYGPHSWLRGRWDDRLPAIEQDIADMETLVDDGRLTRLDEGSESQAVDKILNWSTSQRRACRHMPPERFVRGQDLDIALAPDGVGEKAVTLHFRHVDQSEVWHRTGMVMRGGEYIARIPSGYTDTSYPMEYYFEVEEEECSYFYPGLDDEASNCPYFWVGGNSS